MSAIEHDRSARRAVVRRMVALVACGVLSMASSAMACAPADAALAGRYLTIDGSSGASLVLERDGRFQLLGVAGPSPNIGGCWTREGGFVTLAQTLEGAIDGLRRVLPPALTDADLKALHDPEVTSLAQAVEMGLLPAAGMWAHQPPQADGSVEVMLSEPNLGVAVGPAEVVLRLASGEVLRANDEAGQGAYRFKLPDHAEVRAIGITFPTQADRPRWLTVQGPNKRLYLVEFDGVATGYAEGGRLRLEVRPDGMLVFEFPDMAFKRAP